MKLYLSILFLFSLSLQAGLLEKDFNLKVNNSHLSYQFKIENNFVEWKLNGATFSFYKNKCHRPYLAAIEKTMVPFLIRWRMAGTEKELKSYYYLTINQHEYLMDPENKLSSGISSLAESIMGNIRMANTKCGN